MPAMYDDNSTGFQKAMENANNALSSNHANETSIHNDWAAVGTMVERLYQIALTSGDPTIAVAALDRQYNNYLQNNEPATLVYNGELRRRR